MPDIKVVEGAEAFALGDGAVGALLVHGFQGSPQGMRGLGEYLAERRVAVVAPRLPGHGTTVDDLNSKTGEDWIGEVNAAFDQVAAGRDEVFVVGMSFGAALSIDLAARNPDRVDGLVTLAGWVYTDSPLRFLAPVLARVIKSLPARTGDIADPDATEIATARLPAKAAYEALRFATKRARGQLPDLKCPLLVMHGKQDHTIPERSSRFIHDEAGSTDKESITLERSYHVLTLDYERDFVFERTFEFIKNRSKHEL